jgi:hypothetical protein
VEGADHIVLAANDDDRRISAVQSTHLVGTRLRHFPLQRDIEPLLLEDLGLFLLVIIGVNIRRY